MRKEKRKNLMINTFSGLIFLVSLAVIAVVSYSFIVKYVENIELNSIKEGIKDERTFDSFLDEQDFQNLEIDSVTSSQWLADFPLK